VSLWLPTGVVSLRGSKSVDATVEKLRSMLQANKVELFALVDHSGEAERAGLRMPNTKLLIFGNPALGTPIMLAAPAAALDLPLKILVSEDASAQTWITYLDPRYLLERHQIPQELEANIAAIANLAAKAAD